MRGQVDDGVGAGYDVVEVGPGEIELEAPEAVVPGQPGGVGPLDRRVVVVGEGVEAIDLVAAFEERLADVGADEARRPGHDVSHGRGLLRVLGASAVDLRLHRRRLGATLLA